MFQCVLTMNRRKRLRRSQAAMEYLMTYGWAILIIAVVLGVLFSLGVFSASNFTTKAQPGSCQVSRIGTGLTETVSLNGECQGLLPEFVAVFGKGDGGAVVTDTALLNTYTAGITICAWVYPTSLPDATNFVYEQHSGSQYADVEIASNGLIRWEMDPNQHYLSTGAASVNQWSSICTTYNTSTDMASIYINGALDSSNSGLTFNTIKSGNPTIGADSAGVNQFVGYISNVQLYNTSLSASEVQAYYNHGIGSPPIRIQNLIGWWPLNGNLNDYSGYNNEAMQSGSISYSGFWTSTYTGPS